MCQWDLLGSVTAVMALLLEVMTVVWSESKTKHQVEKHLSPDEVCSTILAIKITGTQTDTIESKRGPSGFFKIP